MMLLLLDLFHYFSPKIVIATHSPIIVSGAESAEPSLSVFKAEAGNLLKLEHSSGNLEALLWSMFGVVTPENRYMSDHFVRYLNRLSEEKISLTDLKEEVALFKRNIYDGRQLEALDGVVDIATEIVNRQGHDG